jgi:NAD(P)H dehydrogenase (quinone)
LTTIREAASIACSHISEQVNSNNPIAMKQVLIVHAHHERKSFCSALKDTARTGFQETGAQVHVTDLYAQKFNPVSDRRNFVTVANPDFLKQQKEEEYASSKNGFALELEAEMQKIETCDLLVFVFPLWWFGLPGILKGWVDRVFAFKRHYGGGRWYEKGVGAGKHGIVLMTTGGPATSYGSNGLHPPMEAVLQPIHHGTFWFNGFAPLEPFIAWGASHVGDKGRETYLQELKQIIRDIDKRPVLPHRPTTEFDPETLVDRAKRFVAHWKISTRWTAQATALVPHELAAVKELWRAGKILEHWMAPDRTTGWLIVRAESVAAVNAILAGLPLHCYLDFSVTEAIRAI